MIQEDLSQMYRCSVVERCAQSAGALGECVEHLSASSMLPMIGAGEMKTVVSSGINKG